MYEGYFGLSERPFSIAPDPQYLYLSARHKEAMAHLSYGLSQGGCFIVLTGEVGTGKTTLCRNLLSDLPDHVDVALILNANINESELLQTVCDELKVEYQNDHSQKQLLDSINHHLLSTFADNRHTVLIIDEAQLLSRDVLEQVRLLTNLETTKSKLLQIILIGQPELNDVLMRNDLRQLAQRVTAKYHLGALEKNEIEEYVNFRLGVAGCKKALFSRQALNKLHDLSGGIPRKINVLADHSLLAAYAQTSSLVDAKTVKKAANDVFIESKRKGFLIGFLRNRWLPAVGLLLLLNLGFLAYTHFSKSSQTTRSEPAQNTSSENTLSGSALRGVEEELITDNSLGDDSIDRVSFADTTSIAEKTGLQQTSVVQISDNTETAKLGDQAQGGGEVEVQVRTPGTMVVSDVLLDDSVTTDITVSSVDSDLGQLLSTSADLTGRIATFRRLAKTWSAELPNQLLEPACVALAKDGIECLGIGTWLQVLRFNRPAIMVIEHQGQLHRVILQSVQGQTATLLVGERLIDVELAELQQRWTNSAITFWRPSAVGSALRQIDDSSSSLPVLRQHLNSALSKTRMPLLVDVESTEFDLDMAQKVFALQSRFGIIADSRIGSETYLLLNEIMQPDVTPVLVSRSGA